MKTITVNVSDELHKRLCRMSVEEPSTGGLGPITRMALEKEVARHEARMKKIRAYSMQEVA